MFGTQDLALFITAGFLLNITPGPDSILVMARTAGQGWRAGSVAALGIGTGCLVHILAAALGLSALLNTSAMAFEIIKYLGAGYLIYVGVSMMLSRARPADASQGNTAAPALSYRKIFMQGLLTNALNPKVALFFLAFVPQFISAQADNKPLAFIVLGLIFNVNAMLWCHFLVLFTALARRKIGQKASHGSLVAWLNRSIGAMFVAFGVKLALAERG
jgi:RhtB (resistance to homoserine/threonine) family protein